MSPLINLLVDSNIELNPNKTIKVDPDTYQTGEPDVFAGGDAVSGPKFAIDGIAMGKKGAISIHRYVHPGQSLTIGRIDRDYRALDKGNLGLTGYDRIPRQKASHGDGNTGKESFMDSRGTFTEEQVKQETERCLGCGATVVDEYQCVGCGVCTVKCKFDAVSLVRVYDEPGVIYERLIPSITPYVLKRGSKIAIKKAKKMLAKRD